MGFYRKGLSCYEILVFLCFNAMTLKLSVLTNMPQLSCSKLKLDQNNTGIFPVNRIQY